MTQPDKKQLDAWKAEHKTIYQLNVGEYSCILKKPNRKTLSYAAASGATDPLKYNETILKECWLHGDEEIILDDELFLSVSSKLSELIHIQEAELVKL